MKKMIIIGLIAIILILTNPSKADFVDWSHEKMIAQSEGILERGFSQYFGRDYIASQTTSQDYVMFSIYTSQLGNYRVITIGILNNFIPVKVEER